MIQVGKACDNCKKEGTSKLSNIIEGNLYRLIILIIF